MKAKIGNKGDRGYVSAISANADNEYQAYSSQVSPIVRMLALTAIAIIWLFANGRSAGVASPFAILHSLKTTSSLVAALALALCALVADLLQYVWGTVAWGTYRWSLEQILINDNWNPHDLSARARLGWAVSRVFHVPRYLEYHMKSIGGESAQNKSWKFRRNSLRNFLRKEYSGSSRTSLTEALDSPWSPLFINRVSVVFFMGKVALLIACYVFLGRFLLT